MEILVIYAEDCIDCETMKSHIRKAVSLVNSNISIRYVDCESQEAIDLAVDYGLDDIPSCIIGSDTFCGRECLNYSTLFKAIQSFNRPCN